MTIIDRYIVRSFLFSYAVLLAVGIGLYVISDLLVNLDEFAENRELSFAEVVWAMADYYGYNVPLYFSQLAGPVMAFAAAYTVGMMLRNNEMSALIAAGMPLQRLAAPILVAAVPLAALWLANRELVLPKFATKIARQRDDVTGTRTASIEFARDDRDAILTARRIRPREGRLEGVVIVEPRLGGGVIQADAATYDASRKTWRLEVGRRISEQALSDDPAAPRMLHYDPVDEYPFTLSPEEVLLRQSSQWTGLLSLQQMNALLRSRNLPNLAGVRMSRHIWLTQPVLQLLLVALVVPFFLVREPCSVLLAGGRALLVAGAFFCISFIAHSMSATPFPALVAWLPILLFTPVAVLQMANVRT